MYWKTVGEIFFSVFAVFGAYALLRMIVAVPFLPKEARLVLRLSADTSVEELPALLERTRANAVFFGAVPIVALLEKGCDPALCEVLEMAGIPYVNVL